MVRLEGEDDHYDAIVGFKRTIPDLGEMPLIPNAIEDFLNENFQEKKIAVDFNYNKNDGSKVVLSLTFDED